MICLDTYENEYREKGKYLTCIENPLFFFLLIGNLYREPRWQTRGKVREKCLFRIGWSLLSVMKENTFCRWIYQTNKQINEYFKKSDYMINLLLK